MRLEVGQTIERFEIQAQIGSGGTAVVYRVVERATAQVYALKVLSLHGPAIRQRMAREGALQAALRHPNIVRVHEVIPIADGSPALVMEHIDGPSLERALTRYRLALPDAELLFLGIVAGVRHAHAAGLVHRDLKPANVLLARTPEGFVPKVTDFGLAKMLAEEPGVLQTRNGIAMGTPAYMAPEQIRDARRVDRRADLFGLGCILYEVVTFQRAFQGDEALVLYNAITHGDYVRPREIVPELPDRLDMAIRGALLTERSRRIPDCDTLIRVMQGLIPWDCSEVPGRVVAAVASNGHAGAVLDSGPGEEWKARDDMRAPLERATGVAVRLEDAETMPYPGSSAPAATLAPSSRWVGFAAAGTVAFGLVLLVGIVAMSAGLFVWWSAGSATPSPPVVVVPQAPIAPVAGPEAAALPPPPVASAPARKPASTPRPSAEPVAPPAPMPASPEPPAAALPPATAVVKLLSDPPTAEVVVDGAARGRTPAKLELSPGRHAIAMKSGEQRTEFVIDVKQDVENRWCYSFVSSRSTPGPCP